MTTQAYCIAVEKKLPSDTCPLANGECYWRHRGTGKCKYTTDELTETEFCQRVGAPPPTPADRDRLLERLRGALT